MEAMMRKLKLSVDQQKTRICRVPEESFDFLGYTLVQGHGRNRFRDESLYPKLGLFRLEHFGTNLP